MNVLIFFSQQEPNFLANEKACGKALKPDKSSSALTPDVEPRNPIPKSCSPIPRMCHPHIIPLYSVPPTIIKNNKVLRKKELDFFQK